MHIPCLLSDAQPLLQILDWLVALAVANKTINEKVNKRQNRIKLAIFIIILVTFFRFSVLGDRHRANVYTHSQTNNAVMYRITFYYFHGYNNNNK